MTGKGPSKFYCHHNPHRVNIKQLVKSIVAVSNATYALILQIMQFSTTNKNCTFPVCSQMSSGSVFHVICPPTEKAQWINKEVITALQTSITFGFPHSVTSSNEVDLLCYST